MSERQALDAVADERDVEVDQETQPVAGELQIRQQSRLVNREQTFDGVELDDYAILNQQVQPETGIDVNTVVLHG